jgi:hypothetical protein
MDFGDLIFLIFIALGGLSSVLGGKKRKQAAQAAKKRPPRPPTTRPERARAVVPATSRDRPVSREPRTDTHSQMERILRELGFDAVVEDEPEPEPEETPWSEIPPERELPRAVSLEPLKVEPEARHQEFHDKYVRPIAAPKDSTQRRPRGHRYVNAASLRGAVLRMEILGPPKSLR